MHGWSGSLINAPYGAYLDHCYAWNLQIHFLRVFVANLKNDAIYAFFPESFCDPNLAIWKVFAFSDSVQIDSDGQLTVIYDAVNCKVVQNVHLPWWQCIILTKMALSAFGNSTSSCMSGRRGRERDWGWAGGGGGGAKSWASSIRQSSSSGMGAGTKDQSCVWLKGEGGAGQNTKCNLPGGRGGGCHNLQQRDALPRLL